MLRNRKFGNCVFRAGIRHQRAKNAQPDYSQRWVVCYRMSEYSLIFAMALETWESVNASPTTIQYIRICICVEARRMCVVVFEYVGGTPVGDKEFLGV